MRTPEQYEAAIVHQEKLIEQMDANKPTVDDPDYVYWQPRRLCAARVLRGLKNPNRGRESLDSFASHGGVNVDVRFHALWFIQKGLFPEEFPGQRELMQQQGVSFRDYDEELEELK